MKEVINIILFAFHMFVLRNKNFQIVLEKSINTMSRCNCLLRRNSKIPIDQLSGYSDLSGFGNSLFLYLK